MPQPGFDPARVQPADVWGSAQAQIFAAVSPQMHEEFALRYEIQVLEHFGLNYYGCCEPLHRKIHVLKNIPRLRKISMSPWADIDEAVQALGDRFVLSYKPARLSLLSTAGTRSGCGANCASSCKGRAGASSRLS